MSPDHDPGRSFPQARVAQDPPPPFELEDYEDLVPGAGHWARAPLERPHGDRAALVPQPIAGFPAARGRGRAAHQAAGALGRGGWERPRCSGTPPLGCAGPLGQAAPPPPPPPPGSHCSLRSPSGQIQALFKAASQQPPCSATPQNPQANGPASSGTSLPSPSPLSRMGWFALDSTSSNQPRRL